MIVQVVISQAKSIEIPQSFNATVFTVSTLQSIYFPVCGNNCSPGTSPNFHVLMCGS